MMFFEPASSISASVSEESTLSVTSVSRGFAPSKTVIREKLVSAYNQALGRKVAEQVYFSDFVVQ